MNKLLLELNHKISKHVWGIICLLIVSMYSVTLHANNPRTYIPPQAFTHKETIKHELDRLFPDIPTYNYIPSLIEHESCISLTHSRCWNSTSELRSSREQGLGLGQTTRAFNADGTVRFDTLGDMRRKYINELREASWDTFKYRPDLQIRLTILLVRDNWRGLHAVPDPMARLHFTNAAYNGGPGWVDRERRACGLATDCDPNYWFGHTERYCLRSTKPVYGNRSICDISRYHVSDVFTLRLPKYENQYFIKEPEPVVEVIEEVIIVEPEPVVEETVEVSINEETSSSKEPSSKEKKKFFLFRWFS